MTNSEMENQTEVLTLVLYAGNKGASLLGKNVSVTRLRPCSHTSCLQTCSAGGGNGSS